MFQKNVTNKFVTSVAPEWGAGHEISMNAVWRFFPKTLKRIKANCWKKAILVIIL